MKYLDVSFPIDQAERRLGVPAGSLSLDELARRLSLLDRDEPISVREWRLSPVTHSGVWRDGELTGTRPYLMTSTGK